MNREGYIAILIGAGAGLLGGLLGVGGGIILVPAMVALLGVSQHQAHGTSLAVMVPLALSGGALYFLKGYGDWWLVAGLALGSTLGAVIGAQAMTRVPAPILRRAFGFFILAVALRLLLGTF